MLTAAHDASSMSSVYQDLARGIPCPVIHIMVSNGKTVDEIAECLGGALNQCRCSRRVERRELCVWGIEKQAESDL